MLTLSDFEETRQMEVGDHMGQATPAPGDLRSGDAVYWSREHSDYRAQLPEPCCWGLTGVFNLALEVSLGDYRWEFFRRRGHFQPDSSIFGLWDSAGRAGSCSCSVRQLPLSSFDEGLPTN